MNGLLLIIKLAGERVAIAASEVESVVEIEGLTPVPRAASHVAGLAALSRLGALIELVAQPAYTWMFGIATYGIYTVLWAAVNIVDSLRNWRRAFSVASGIVASSFSFIDQLSMGTGWRVARRVSRSV